MPAFHCLLPVRDEADIIGQNLQHALTWADAIYVFDTGSVDDTWDIVQQAAARDKRVVPLRKEPVYFSETRLRGGMFHLARSRMRDGDWFLRMDADEFHHVPPPEFIKTRMSAHETIAYHQYFDFRLLQSEVKGWEEGQESLRDRARPIEDRRRHYTVSVYAEPRLCRYRSTMQWPATVSFPFNAGYVARERLPIRHYPHRDPAQLERRCRLRAVMMADKENRSNWSRPELHHWAEAEWRKFITPDDLPELEVWMPGTDLPHVRQLNHLRGPLTRAAQRLTHAFLLPLLDARRPAFNNGTSPQQIPAEIVQRLEAELRL
ncbi:MAG: glycosyltransferase family 2 protein [Prosthecobacter sp.]|jgi:glycosyltransferase involved in cell wall biosynthesis|uniref:glycosyltransferase family 2 protein n=1 Tax=Prosthecobacter sp. TaxID=1965333 RepID=UPI001A0EB0B9|nr:glycosyltransferase family 2 protein [Prosthecobacter sp.]MBE2286880.1 glycosyltransferase family 2 protein [Prosthecobacter sp.]